VVRKVWETQPQPPSLSRLVSAQHIHQQVNSIVNLHAPKHQKTGGLMPKIPELRRGHTNKTAFLSHGDRYDRKNTQTSSRLPVHPLELALL
jgi:hypothetical protein